MPTASLESAGVSVRPERDEDFAAVAAIQAAAFERESEALLVQALRRRPEAISLVAWRDGVRCGHILFSPVRAGMRAFAVAPLGMGPVAVAPDAQYQGIGKLLVQAGLAECRARRVPFVVVLGHADYYPRFGFVPASRFGLHCQWPVPDEVFMAQELEPGGLAGVAGLVSYAPEFSR